MNPIITRNRRMLGKSVLLTLTFLFVSVLSVCAASIEDNGLKYTIIDGTTASVSAIDKTLSGEVVIPSAISIEGKEYTVSTIADEGFKFTDITSISLPSTIELIGSSAFFRCLSLKTIVLPPSVREIGNDAFYYCSDLTDIHVAQGNPYFRNVGKAVVDKSNAIVAYPGKGEEKLTISEGIKGIKDNAFSGCESLKEIIIPSSVEYVGYMAFLFCVNLQSVHWNAAASSIPFGCFQGCSSLEEVVLSESVTDIGGMAFYGTSLRSITLKGSMPPSFDMSSDTSTFEDSDYDSDYENVVVYVPKGSLETYHSSKEWGKFKAIVEEEENNCLEWFLITDNNEQFNMNTVGMLVAADESQYFSVLDLYGNVLAEDVLRVQFRKLDITGVKNILVDEPQNMLKSYVKDKLILVGAHGTVNVYSVSGMKVASTQATKQETIVDVSTLPEGIYIIKCGRQSFKFNKK